MSVMSMIDTDRNAAAGRVAQSLAASHATSKAAAASGSSSTSSAAAAAETSGITSSDFLTLLVTEMKNQDPTQPTDPNAYIQQLVGVNSLQQLISINQELGGLGSTTSTGAATGASSVSQAGDRSWGARYGSR